MKSEERTFISYSSKDFQLVSDLVKYLESQGVSCWYAPRNIVPGKHYASSILEAIRAANAFIIVFSKNSNQSEQCLKEVDRAVNAKKPIIPFRIDETMPAEAMDYYLCNTHWLNAYEEVVTNYYQQLVHAVHDFISIDSDKTEYKTEVKEAKVDKISKELQDVIQSLREEAIRDEEAAQIYRREKDRLEEEIEARQNATVVEFPAERTRQLIRKETKPLVIEAKKKRSRNREKIEEETNQFEVVKRKVVFPLAVIAVAATLYMYRSMVSENSIKVVKEEDPTKKEQVKKKEEVVIETDYRKDFLDKNKLETYGIEKLKEIKNIISTRDGNIIRRTRTGLVESEWTLREVQNYFLLDHLIYKKGRPQNKGMTSRVYLNFDMEKETSIMKVKDFWEAGSLLLKEKLYDNDLDLVYLRPYPQASLTSFPKTGELVLTVKIVENEERYLKVKHSSGMKIRSTLVELEQFAENVDLPLKTAEAGSSWPSNEIVIEFHTPQLPDDAYQSLAVQVIDIARLFVNSKELLSSI